MRPFALAASVAAVLLAVGAHAQAQTPTGAPTSTGAQTPAGGQAPAAAQAPANDSADTPNDDAEAPRHTIGKTAVAFKGGPPTIEAPDYPPPSARWAVMGVGLATTGVFYGAAVGMSYAYPDVPGAHDLRKPIIGPWLAIAHNGCAASEGENCSTVWLVMRAIAEGIGGIAQAGGVLVMLEGVFMPTQYKAETRRTPQTPSPTPSPWKPPPPATEPPKPNDKNLFWIPTPMALGSRGVGVGVVGNF
jgi:hypothetical protein